MELARQCIDHLEKAQKVLVADVPEVEMIVNSLNAEYVELEDNYQDLMLFYSFQIAYRIMVNVRIISDKCH